MAVSINTNTNGRVVFKNSSGIVDDGKITGFHAI